MRVLQVGLGRWGRNHLRTWREIGVELLLCDREPRVLEELAPEEPHSTDPEALIGAADAVDIVTTAETHVELVERALELGKDVFVEKPLAPTSAEAAALARRACVRGRILQVGHVFRFAGPARAAHAALERGDLGKVRYLIAHFMGFKRPRSDGGVAISDAIHFVDLSAWLLGGPPQAVTAVMRDYLGRGLDDLAVLSLEYEDGVVALVEAGYFPPEPRRDLVVMGSEGAVACDFLSDDKPVRLYTHAHRRAATGTWHAEKGEVRIPKVDPTPPLRAELEAFVAACTEREPSAIAADGFAGSEAVAVIEAALRSAREGRRVSVPSIPRA